MNFLLSLFVIRYVAADSQPIIPETPPVEIAAPLPEPEPVIFATSTRESSAKALIATYAEKYKVLPNTMYKVVSCETGGTFDPGIQSLARRKDGTQEDSWGLAQIHLPDHPDVTKEQATDPDFAIEFLAKNISEGRPYLWTCWRNLKQSGEL